MGDYQTRFCESFGVKFPLPARLCSDSNKDILLVKTNCYENFKNLDFDHVCSSNLL